MTRSAAPQPFLSPALAAGLVVISALSLIAFLVLSAYAPGLRTDRSAGANALSTSAVGFAGLRLLLQDTGTDTTLGRLPPQSYAHSLVVLTPTATTGASDLKAALDAGPTLIVLPKWATFADPQHAGWVISAGTFDGKALAALLTGIAEDVAITHGRGVSPIQLGSPSSRFGDIAPAGSLQIRSLQSISGGNLEPDIVTDTGQAVLVRLSRSRNYILSDPDLLDNLGIRDLTTARLAVGLVQTLRVGTNPVSFDLTLNGFRGGPNFLYSAFSPPFLGATLCLLLAAAFIAVHAFNRFGPPRPADKAHAMGKRALADNTAAVIRMLHRETRMGTRYAEAMLNGVATQAGVSRARARQAGWLQALERRSGTPYRFEDLQAEADAVGTTTELMQVAARLYNWRRGITHEHR